MTGGGSGVGSVFLGVTEHFRPLETWYVNYRTCGCQQKSFKRITWVPKIPKDRGDRFRNGSQRQQTWNAQMPSFYAQWCWATSSSAASPPMLLLGDQRATLPSSPYLLGDWVIGVWMWVYCSKNISLKRHERDAEPIGRRTEGGVDCVP